jgi:hypothetical protein
MLSVYAKAGGAQPALLLHDQENGSELVDRLGRLAQAEGKTARHAGAHDAGRPASQCIDRHRRMADG